MKCSSWDKSSTTYCHRLLLPTSCFPLPASCFHLPAFSILLLPFHFHFKIPFPPSCYPLITTPILALFPLPKSKFPLSSVLLPPSYFYFSSHPSILTFHFLLPFSYFLLPPFFEGHIVSVLIR